MNNNKLYQFLFISSLLLSVFPCAKAENVVVGAINGQISQTQAGAAAYTIPLECPAGVGGMQPSLSLVYNSQGGNGLAGMGWNIGGLSCITRGQQNLYYDSSIRAINWDNNDPFYFDGSKLIEKQSWADSTEYCTESNPSTYIRSYGKSSLGPTSFKVFTKEGRILFYGNPDNQASYSPAYKNPITRENMSRFGWNLVKVIDTNGNYMTYTYSESEGTGKGNVLRQISYGGNLRNGKQHDLSIYFDYEIRPDTVQGYVSGKQILQQLRLSKIRELTGSFLTRSYELKYKEGSSSYLSSLAQYNGGSETYRPIEFTYGTQDGSTSDVNISQIRKDSNNAEKEKKGLIAADLDGDGYVELCDLSVDHDKTYKIIESYTVEPHWKSNNWANEPSKSFIQSVNTKSNFGVVPLMGDFNENGAVDNVFLVNKDDKLFITISDKKTGLDLITDYALGHYDTQPFTAIGSFKGEPRAVLLMVKDSLGQQGSVYSYRYKQLSYSKSGEFKDETKAFTVPSELRYIASFRSQGIAYYDDLLLELKDSSVYILKNAHDGTFDGSKIKTNLHIPFGAAQTISDINGDGLDDIIYLESTNNFKIAYNRGDYTFEIKSLPFYCNKEGYIYRYQLDTEQDCIYSIDFNNDGLLDFVIADERYKAITDDTAVFDYTSWSFYRNTGNGYAVCLAETSLAKARYAAFGDFKGDGTISWAHENSSNETVITDLGFSPYKNMLKGITNPIKGNLQLEYKPQPNCVETSLNIAEPSHNRYGYLTSRSSLYPVFSSCNDGVNKISYTYGDGLVVNWNHRGSMGFRFVREKNEGTDISKLTSYESLDSLKENSSGFYPEIEFHILVPEYTKVFRGENLKNPIQEDSYNYDVVISNFGNKNFFTKLIYSESKNYLEGTESKTVYQYDDYGNVLKQKLTSGDLTEIKTFTYGTFGSWCPNKVIQAKVERSLVGNASTLSHTTNYTYDSKGNLETQHTADDGRSPIISYLLYDVYGHSLRQTIASQGVTRATQKTYTSSGRFIQTETNESNQTTTYTWDEERGRVLSQTDFAGRVTNYTYNNANEVIKTDYPDGSTETVETAFSKRGPVSQLYDSDACYYVMKKATAKEPTADIYNSKGLKIISETRSVFNNKVIRQYTTYDDLGRVVKVSYPSFSTSSYGAPFAQLYNYDIYGRPYITQTRQGYTKIEYSPGYKKVSSPLDTVEIRSNSTGWELSRKTNGKTVAFSYNPEGKVVKATPEGGSPIIYTYSNASELVQTEDPDAGIKRFSYNGFGDFTREETGEDGNPNGLISSYTYASNGLVQTIAHKENTIKYVYDDHNRISEVSILGGHVKTFVYDAYDHLMSVTEKIGTKSFVTNFEYDAYGRISKTTYPSGYSITNTYYTINSDKPTSIKDSNNKILWENLGSDAEQRILSERKGTKITTSTYNYQGQLLTHITPGIINDKYEYEIKNGNMKSYQDLQNAQSETYSYDKMDRLISFSKGNDSGYTEYDPQNGNMLYKYDMGHDRFNYESSRPHAITSLNYQPEEMSRVQQTYTYNSFNKIKHISAPDDEYEITYGVDDERVKTDLYYTYILKETRYYLPNYEEEYIGNKCRKIHYIYGGNGLAAIHIIGTDSTCTYTAYTNFQGSLQALTKDSIVVEYYAYDPWGKRRNPLNWSQADTCSSHIVLRGYTMHEHLPFAALINMNGRVYDPLTGQFLSPDPYLQESGNWLNYNRYAYSLNNPLKYVDPDGHIAWFIPLIGAVLGAYSGGIMANDGQFNPIKWDYSSAKTWGFAISGGLLGAASATVGNNIMLSGIPMANTASIAVASFINSAGTFLYTGGQVPISISLGAFSYDFTNGVFGYLGKKGNKWLENLDYGLGALATLSDLLEGFSPKDVDLVTENSSAEGHSAIVKAGTRTGVESEIGNPDPNGIISVGPDYKKEPSGSWHWMKGKNRWNTHSAEGDSRWIQTLKVNYKTVKAYANWLNKMDAVGKLVYSVELSSCVTHTSVALNLSGLFNIGIHPYLLHAQMYLWGHGIRPWSFSYFSKQ